MSADGLFICKFRLNSLYKYMILQSKLVILAFEMVQAQTNKHSQRNLIVTWSDLLQLYLLFPLLGVENLKICTPAMVGPVYAR